MYRKLSAFIMMMVFSLGCISSVFAEGDVSVSLSPKEQVVGRPVDIKVQGNLDDEIYKNPMYIFFEYDPDSQGLKEKRQTIRNWDEDSKMTWIPKKVGTYQIEVYIQPNPADIEGNSKDYRIVKKVEYTVKEKPTITEKNYSLTIEGMNDVLIPKSGNRDVKFKALVKNENKEVDEEIIWKLNSKDNPGVSLDKMGNLTITDKAKEGQIEIEASLKENADISDKKIVTLKKEEEIKITGIELDVTNKTINIDESLKLQAKVYPSNASTNGLIWKSDNSSVATVNSEGYVTGINSGIAVITVETLDGKFTSSVEVRVKSNQVEDNFLPNINKEYKIPDFYIIVNQTMIDLDYFKSNPEVLVDELNKHENYKIYISTSLTDLIDSSNMISNIEKIIDKDNPAGKLVSIAKVDVEYKKVFGDVGIYKVNIKNNIKDAKYFSIGNTFDPEHVIGEQAVISSLDNNIPIYFYNEKGSIIGMSEINKQFKTQSVIVKRI